MNPLVSVIIPVHNSQDYLNECLDSIVGQTFQNIEIIVINDGSTDNSLNIIRKYSLLDNRFVVIDQPNSGSGQARNKGIDIAKGEYILFVDSDDFIKRNLIEIIYKKTINENLDICIFQFSEFKENKKIISNSNIRIYDRQSHNNIFKQALIGELSPVPWNKLFKKEIFIKHQIRFPKWSYTDDLATIYKPFFFSKGVNVYNGCLYMYRIHEGGISKKINIKSIEEAFFTIKNIDSFLKEKKVSNEFEKEFNKRCEIILNSILDKICLFEKNEQRRLELACYYLNKLKNNSYEFSNQLEKSPTQLISSHRKKRFLKIILLRFPLILRLLRSLKSHITNNLTLRNTLNIS